MRDYGTSVEWYRNCIHQQQRAVSTLSIEVGLEAQDNQDPGALAETMECLDTAIAILEQAKAIGNVTAEGGDAQSEAELVAPPQQLMDDLGHSMALLDLGPDTARDGDGSPFRDARSPSASDWLSGVVEDSLPFFE
ncbi:MAG TPA: hypothetical protein VIP09_16395 [Dehalococcoidia bacterium]|jgi:hypothetical protein